MEIVMVEFAVGAELLDECVQAVQELTRSLVAQQAHFYGATVTVDTSAGVVVNLMRWESAQHFIRFRDSNQHIIGPKLGRYGPTPRVLAVAAEIDPARV